MVHVEVRPHTRTRTHAPAACPGQRPAQGTLALLLLGPTLSSDFPPSASETAVLLLSFLYVYDVCAMCVWCVYVVCGVCLPVPFLVLSSWPFDA